MPTDVLWIGLNDQRNQMLFEWSDHSHVTFTQWQTDEPSHATNLQEDCVLIRGKVTPVTPQIQMGQMIILLDYYRIYVSVIQDGKWADHMCEKTYGYICKKKASIKPAEGTQEEVNPGCKLVSDVISFWFKCDDTIKPSDQIHTHCVCVFKMKGSVRFGSHCYNIGAETKTFDKAKQACSEAGAHLVDVADRYIFILVSYMC